MALTKMSASLSYMLRILPTFGFLEWFLDRRPTPMFWHVSLERKTGVHIRMEQLLGIYWPWENISLKRLQNGTNLISEHARQAST
jgi:hypothetical protein